MDGVISFRHADAGIANRYSLSHCLGVLRLAWRGVGTLELCPPILAAKHCPTLLAGYLFSEMY